MSASFHGFLLTFYNSLGLTNEDSRRLSIVSLEDEDSLGLTNIKDLAIASSDDSNVRITDYNTGAHHAKSISCISKQFLTVVLPTLEVYSQTFRKCLSNL